MLKLSQLILLRSILIISLYMPRSCKWSLSFTCPSQTLYAYLFSPVRAPFPTSLSFLGLINLTTFDAQKISLYRLLRDFLQPRINASLFDPIPKHPLPMYFYTFVYKQKLGITNSSVCIYVIQFLVEMATMKNSRQQLQQKWHNHLHHCWLPSFHVSTHCM